MPDGLARDIRAESALAHPGTAQIGEYQMLRSGDSVGGLIPMRHARALGLTDVGRTIVHVNFELGIVIHEIPDTEEDPDDE